ncbi:hypothetical protein GQ53DRAFT_264910 [Thozetella sp. PMI_491]|nr:hypothetical protein GQ53DRAFT_264910 [Thozetella sp. PMI_491]
MRMLKCDGVSSRAIPSGRHGSQYSRLFPPLSAARQAQPFAPFPTREANMSTTVSTTTSTTTPATTMTTQTNVADVKILSFTVTDIRFPTSLDGVGEDAMHQGTNGSHPYVRLNTNHPELVGEGIVCVLLAFPSPEVFRHPANLVYNIGVQQWPWQRAHLHGARDICETSRWENYGGADAQYGQDMALHGIRQSVPLGRA